MTQLTSSMSIMSMPVIIGLGKTGLSCARYYARQNKPFALIDTRKNPPGLAEFKALYPDALLFLGGFCREWLDNACEIILSPGISPEEPELKNLRLISDIELFAHAAKAPIIGITGTNAKGTVTTLVGDMIAASGFRVLIGGNIGTPALDLLIDPTPDFYVLEISSFQLETTHYLPLKAGCILNISPDHLDRHKTMENYIAAKQKIYQQCENAIYNYQDENTKPSEFYMNNIKNLNYFNKNLNHFSDLSPENLKIKGAHNWSNILAAITIGEAINLPREKMIAAAKLFPGLEHRCEWITAKNHIDWYNDSKGTNIGATLAALEGLGKNIQGKIILLAGGIGKDADFTLMQSAIQNYTRSVIVFGRDASILTQAWTGFAEEILHADNLKHAIQLASDAAKPGDAVLLSPACASFDMFRDFEDRGKQFKLLVKEYIGHDASR